MKIVENVEKRFFNFFVIVLKMLKFVSHLRLVESYRVYTLSLPKKHYFPVLQPKRKKIAIYFDS